MREQIIRKEILKRLAAIGSVILLSAVLGYLSMEGYISSGAKLSNKSFRFNGWYDINRFITINIICIIIFYWNWFMKPFKKESETNLENKDKD